MYMLKKTNLTIYMNKFQHSAHPVLLIGERCVKVRFKKKKKKKKKLSSLHCERTDSNAQHS